MAENNSVVGDVIRNNSLTAIAMGGWGANGRLAFAGLGLVHATTGANDVCVTLRLKTQLNKNDL